MLEKAIYKAIKNDATISAKLLNGSLYNIFPANRVPENIDYQKCVTYSIINDTQSYPAVMNALIQINCYAKKYDDAVDLAEDIIRIFDNKKEYKLGSELSVTRTAFTNKSDFYIPETKEYVMVVEISIKH